MGLIVRQARELGLDILMGGDGWDSQRLAEIAQVENLNRCCFSSPYSAEDTSSINQAFVAAYQKEYKERPRVLLLDEPSMGLAPLLVKEIFSIIKTINEEGTTVLLVEQNANMALSIADYAYVLETGRITLRGPAADLSASEAVRKAYLGG